MIARLALLPLTRAAADAAIDFEIRAKIEKYKAELAKLPDFTEASAKKSADALQKSLYQQAAKQAAGLAKANQSAADIAGKSWSDLGKKVSELAGGPFSRLGSAIFDLVPKAGAAGQALGGAAVAGAGLAGAAVGIAAVSAALVGVVNYGLGARDRLREIGQESRIPKESLDALNDYERATKDLKTDVDAAAASLAGKLAPALTTASDLFKGAVTDTAGFAARLAEATGSSSVLDTTWKALHGTANVLTLGVLGAAEGLRDHVQSIEAVNAANRQAIADEKELGDLYERTVGKVGEEARATVDAARAKDEQARATRAAADARRDEATAAREQAEAEEQIRLLGIETMRLTIEGNNARREAVAAWFAAETEALDGARDAWDGYGDRVEGVYDRIVAAAKQATRDQLDLADQLAGYTVTVAQSATSAVVESIQTRTKAGKQAAKVGAAFEKAASLFGIEVQTALAVARAFALFGPPPSPAGILASAAAISSGVAQAAKVRSAPAPSFLVGTSRVPGSPGAAVPTTLHGDEGVVSGAGAFERIGRVLVDAVNSGTQATRSLAGALGGRSSGRLVVDLDAGAAGRLRGTGRTGYRTGRG